MRRRGNVLGAVMTDKATVEILVAPRAFVTLVT